MYFAKELLDQSGALRRKWEDEVRKTIAKHPDQKPERAWTTVSGLGDRDTTCAIVGGIVALAVGPEGIPREYVQSREPLDSTLTYLDRNVELS